MAASKRPAKKATNYKARKRPATRPEFSDEDLADAVAIREAALQYRSTHKREFTPEWYRWQYDAFAATRDHLQVMILASNRSGKTYTASYINACHTVGDYPEGWPGYVIEHPVTTWMLGVDGLQVKDVVQKELLGTLGPDGIWRDGWIHHDEILETTRNNSGGVERAMIRHRMTGDISELSFKAYSQSDRGTGSLPMAGSNVDVMGVDEQPPDSIVGQLTTRTALGCRGKGGRIVYSMTPELGLTALVAQFMNERLPHQALIGPVAWEDAPHLDKNVQAALLAGYQEYERDMRTKGVPLFGTGRILSYDESRVVVDPFDLTPLKWWRGIRAIDLGSDHPAAGAWLALNPETDTVYVCRTWKKRRISSAAEHAAVMNSMWPNTPCVIPHDFDTTEKGSGKTTGAFYRQAGLTNVLPFSNPDDEQSHYVEPGIFALKEALQLDKLKVFRNEANDFVVESRIYHRDLKGKIVKTDDDVIDAVRYGHQMVRRFGVELGSRVRDMSLTLRPDLGLRVTDARGHSLRSVNYGTRTGRR